ncbi:hypothetical protein CHLRE_04g217951v5 [Chlamydomonas reinhardtii]|uniref:Uncharacterized protein n=1 Tax=Chlamydomonas reinhardtii TaxID=3055 RepID=A0A2K3DTI4_CHLRE|nr:uncharacterized protein CHLRE_04g217951v5 [Chlamydomonas reinhardtii]PNW83850.1 hypothetical protein CHLRE_04g217951v5 [Chlamydomonas reinhardtii]
MPSKRPRSGPANVKPTPTELHEAVLKCTLCNKLIDPVDDYRLLDCGVCNRDDNCVHEDCIGTYLKKEGRDQAQKTGFKCPTTLANGKSCKGHISKSHPHVASNEKKKEARRAPSQPRHNSTPHGGATKATAKGSVVQAVKAAMTQQLVVKPSSGPSSTRFSPPLPPAQPSNNFTLGDFFTWALPAAPSATNTTPPAPLPTTTTSCGNVWLDRTRQAYAKGLTVPQGHQAQQVVSAETQLLQQLSERSEEAEDAVSFDSANESLTLSATSDSTSSGTSVSVPSSATLCMLLGNLSLDAPTLLGSPGNLGSHLPSPSMDKPQVQELVVQELDQVSTVICSKVASVTTIRNLICSGQLAWLTPVATELQQVMMAAAGGGQVLYCSLINGDGSSSLPNGDTTDPIVAVQPVFELSITPTSLPSCPMALDLTQTMGMKVVRDPCTLACYNPEDCFGPGYSLVGFKVLLPEAGEEMEGSNSSVSKQSVVAQGVPIRRSQILAAGGMASASEAPQVAIGATPVSTQSFLTESDDELALELGRLCGCSC